MKTISRRTFFLQSGAGAVLPVLTGDLPQSSQAPAPQEIHLRPIPSTGEKLPVVGLGTWQQFDIDPAAEERTDLMEVLRNLAAKGGRMIDTSPMYGRAEETVGALTQTVGPDRFFYATKVWTSGKEAGIRQMEQSFRLMKRRRMDLMQVHNLVDWQVHLPTLKQWKTEGKIRYTGITHYAVSAHPQLEQLIRTEKPDFVQVNYSIRVRNAEKSLLKAAQDKGVAVIVNEPFESGALFRLVKNKALPPWAGDLDIHSWAQFFLKFILSHPAVTCVIPGTSNPRHVLDNLRAGVGRLPDQGDRQKMAALLDSL